MDPPEGYVALPCLVCGRVYQTLREVTAGLLLSLIAAAVVLAGGSGLSEDHLRVFAAGAWLIVFGLGVTALLVGWRLLRSARD